MLYVQISVSLDSLRSIKYNANDLKYVLFMYLIFLRNEIVNSIIKEY